MDKATPTPASVESVKAAAAKWAQARHCGSTTEEDQAYVLFCAEVERLAAQAAPTEQAPVVQAGEYPPLPEKVYLGDDVSYGYDSESLRDYVDADRAAAQVEPVRMLTAEIEKEVARATAKFPTWPTDPLHAVAVLGEEFGELTKAVLQRTYEPHKSSLEDVRCEAVQTAAMALRFLVSLDVYQYRRGEQHAQGAAVIPADGEVRK